MNEVRLIDANALKENMMIAFDCENATKYGNKDAEQQAHSYSTLMLYEISNIVEDCIDNAPTVEPDCLDCLWIWAKDDKGGKERPQGEWIPVSERLPERYKEVIVTDIETSGTYVSRYIGDGYWECDNGPFKHRIIAWQPLPEPYKEVKKNENY